MTEATEQAHTLGSTCKMSVGWFTEKQTAVSCFWISCYVLNTVSDDRRYPISSPQSLFLWVPQPTVLFVKPLAVEKDLEVSVFQGIEGDAGHIQYHTAEDLGTTLHSTRSL